MSARILPREEWGRLYATGIPVVTDSQMRPDDVDVVVVERDGEIVAGVSLVRITHLEGLWIAPRLRGNAGAWRRLVRASIGAPTRWGDSWVFAGAGSDEMRDLLPRLGGRRVEMDTYVLPVVEG